MRDEQGTKKLGDEQLMIMVLMRTEVDKGRYRRITFIFIVCSEPMSE